ncbi:carbamoyltransferase C-terminal domain-containing protein [Micromonospora sp. DT201]|uniref:carbamoyltransferase C-terminal domain-containing protein n=1 Tax=Micromonospora sp. DT201 TaxID=3393442 RepID=UPI003CF53F7C
MNGVVVSFIEQERLSRRKHGIGELPHAAAATVLAEAGVAAEDVDLIAYGWDLAKFNRLRGRDVDLDRLAGRLTGMEVLAGRPVVQTLHHDAHAASSFYGSGLSEATVLVVDAEGEDESATVFHAGAQGLRRVHSWGRGQSLGLMYRAVSEFCGFGTFGAGKTMGLSSWCPDSFEPLPLLWHDGDLQSPFPNGAWEDDVVDGWLTLLTSRFGPPSRPAEEPGYPPWQAHQPQAAAAAQQAVNQAMLGLVDAAIGLTGCPDVCLAGGVALNCVANGLLLDRVRTLHIPPYPHDAGVALGAAQLAGLAAGQPWRDRSRAATGPLPSANEAADAATARGLPVRASADPVADARQLLVEGKTIGWVQGPMEVGPRALGNRSILALPDPEGVRDRLNARKGREPWRPLAPSLLREETDRLLGRSLDSPFMLLSVQLSEQGRQLAPAAAHRDSSARVQTVDAGPGPYRALIEQVREATGTGVVLNTSLNRRGEPLVHTGAQAVDTAAAIGLDALLVGDVVIDTAVTA